MSQDRMAPCEDVERTLLFRILAAGVEASGIPVCHAEISERGRVLAVYHRAEEGGARVERHLGAGSRWLRLEADVEPEVLHGLAERLAPHLEPLEPSGRSHPAGEVEQGQVEEVSEGASRDFEHRIRTRLTVARGWVELLRSERVGPARERDALAITSRQLADIERLLRARRGPAVGEGDGEDGDAEAPPLVDDDLEAAVRHCIRDSAWSVSAQVDGPLVSGVPRPVRVDGDHIRDVLLHLLDNATEHTPPGSRVEVRLSYEPDRVRLSVEDDGPGFPEDLATRLGTGSHVVDRLATALGATVVRGRAEHLGGAAVQLLWGA